jgi:hypothetical protein
MDISLQTLLPVSDILFTFQRHSVFLILILTLRVTEVASLLHYTHLDESSVILQVGIKLHFFFFSARLC